MNLKAYNRMKVRVLVAVLVMFLSTAFFVFSNGQSQNPQSYSGKIVEDPDLPPLFTGGSAEMHKFISKSLRYPDEAVKHNKQGLVVYTFVVEKDGTLSNFELIHRADPSLDQEALRILQQMPPWRPAKYKDQAVRSKSYVPMYFRLNKNARAMAARRKTMPFQNNKCATNTTSAQYKNSYVMQSVDSEVYSIVEKMPEYKYGEKELKGFIEHQLRYPKEALQQGIEGRVLCSFIVGADGTIFNIEVIQGVDYQLDREAVRVLGLMSKWIPGERDGEKVNVKYLYPVDFKINEKPIP